VLYDDGEEEWTALQRENFKCLLPRARSAGCTSDFREAMMQLGGGRDDGHPAMPGAIGTLVPSASPAPQPPAIDATCVGWTVSVRCALDGKWYLAEVLSYCEDPPRRLLVLYDDGEDEWLDADREELTWHFKTPEEGREGVFPGVAPGTERPQRGTAVGWRVSVFWPGDAAFYPGEITGWDEAEAKHEVSYDDGEEGSVTLGLDRIKWLLPPGVAVDHENLERIEAGALRPARKVTVGGDSDPDYEVRALFYSCMNVCCPPNLTRYAQFEGCYSPRVPLSLIDDAV
jgi:hypothetical protein